MSNNESSASASSTIITIYIYHHHEVSFSHWQAMDNAAESAEEDEFGVGETEERPGELTRIQQEDAEKKEIARRKRYFIVNVQKRTDDYLYILPDDQRWGGRHTENA